MLLGFEGVNDISDKVNWLGPPLEAGGDSNTSGGFHLVTSKHPHLDAGITQTLNDQGNVVLELVLDTCDTEELHTVLKLVNAVLDQLFSVVKVSFGGFVPLLPVSIVLRCDQLLGDNQRSEPFISQVIA